MCVCEQWLELVLGWLSKVFVSEVHADCLAPAPSAPSPSCVQAARSVSPVLKQWRCHMHKFFCRIYVNMRIEELFSIIRGVIENSVYSCCGEVEMFDFCPCKYVYMHKFIK